MSANQHGACRLKHVETTAQHVKEVVLDDRRARRRQGGNRQCALRRSSHRVNVAKRMGRGNPAEQIRIVDHRAEKIDGLQQRRRPGERDQRRIVRAVETNHDRAARRRMEPPHGAAEDRRRDLRGATAAAHRAFTRLGLHFGQFGVAPHPAAIYPLFQLPQPRAIRHERSARGDGLLIPGADERQSALLRHGAPQSPPGERAAQIGGERRTLADRVNPGLLARMGEYRRDVAGREDLRVSGRAQPVVDRDEAFRRQRKAGVGEPAGGTGLRHPQRLVEFDPPAIGAEQNTRRDTHNGAAGVHGNPVIGEDLLEEPADPGIV